MAWKSKLLAKRLWNKPISRVEEPVAKSIAPAKANLRNIPRNLTQRVSPVPLEPAPPGNHLFQAFAALCLVFLMSQVMVDVWRNHTDAAAVKAGKLPRQLAGDKGGRARCVYLLLLCHPKILRNLPDIPASLCVSGTNVCCSLMKWSFPTLIFDISDRKLLRLFMIKIKTHGFCVFFPPVFFWHQDLCHQTLSNLLKSWRILMSSTGARREPVEAVEVLRRRFRLS